MSVTSGFFNSLDSDRLYNAEQMSQILMGIIHDGVFKDVGTALKVVAYEGNTIRVGIGKAWFDNYWLYNDTILPIEMTPAAVAQPRYDAVVIDVNWGDSVRACTIITKEGTAQSSPTHPSMINSSTQKQYPLAYILRPAGSTSIIADNIEDQRGSSSCPFIQRLDDSTTMQKKIYVSSKKLIIPQ